MRILYLTENLDPVSGVTTHLKHLTQNLPGEIQTFILCGRNKHKESFTKSKVFENKFLSHDNRSVTNYFKACKFLLKFCKENKIDILHSHTHYSANMANHVSKLYNLKTVQTNHGILKTKGKLGHFKADKYIAINEHIYEHMLKSGTVKKKIYFIRCGIFVPDKPPVKKNKRLKILMAARLTKEKGADIFIKAAAKLKDVNIEFIIAGTGREENNLKKLDKKLHAGVTFKGEVKDMTGLLKESDIFVFTGRTDTEGFPAVITEAGAYNNFVISSEFNGLSPVFKNNDDGYTFETDNINQLIIKINEAAANPGREKISLKFYNKVKSLYAIEEMIQKHLEVYNMKAS